MDLSAHRTLYNGDWGALFWAPRLWQPEGGPYTVRAMHRFADLLADSGVDTFLISPNTQIAWYPSKVVPTVLDNYTRGDPAWARWMRSRASETNIAMMNLYLDLAETGVDWLAEEIAACRQRGVSPWVSVRMNDPHGYLEKWVDNPINCPLFKDPENRLSGTPLRPGRLEDVLWVGLNYERPAVRDYMLRMITELVTDYDAEGLELDYLRTPAICEPNASQQTIDTLTAWTAEVRALTKARAAKTGRPYPLGLRIPANLGALRSIGLDIAAIVDAGLVDFLSFSNYMQTAWDMPHDRLRQTFGDRVTIYGNIECAVNGIPAYSPEKGLSETRSPYVVTQALHGAAAGKLALGADGIELYNYYAIDEDNAGERICTWKNIRADYTAIAGVSDLEQLRGKPKLYTLNTIYAPVWNPPFDTPDPLPEILEPDWRRVFQVPMCAEPADRDLELVIQIVVERQPSLAPVGVSFNGSWPVFGGEPTDRLLFPQREFTHHLPEYTALNYHCDVAEIRDGWNAVSVYNGCHIRDTAQQRRENAIKVVDIGLAVRNQAAGAQLL